MARFLEFTNAAAPEKKVLINVEQVTFVWTRAGAAGASIGLSGSGAAEVLDPFDEVVKRLKAASAT